jgi:hypothetical protein
VTASHRILTFQTLYLDAGAAAQGGGGVEGSGAGGVEEARWLMNGMMPLVLACAGHSSNDVSQAGIEFVTAYITSLKRSPSEACAEGEELGRILEMLARKLTLHPSFDFDNNSPEDEAFLDLRRQLLIIFKNITRLSPGVSVHFVTQRFRLLLHKAALHGLGWDAESYGEVEGALTMLYELGEVKLCLDFAGNQHAAHGAGGAGGGMGSALGEVLDLVFSSSVSVHPHPAVQRAYLELVNRYAQFLQQNQHHIPKVLLAFLNAVSSSSGKVRSRGCYLFLRVLKTLRSQVAAHIGDMMRMLEPLLLQDQLEHGSGQEGQEGEDGRLEHEDGRLEHQDRLFLFEAAGNVMGAEGLPPATAAWYLTKVLEPLLARMDRGAEEYRAASLLHGHAQLASQALRVHRSVGATLESIGWMSKGCAKICASLSPLLQRALEIAVAALALVPRTEVLSSGGKTPSILSSTLLFLHRMLDCLGAAVLPALPSALSILLASTSGPNGRDGRSVPEVTEVVTLTNQVVARYKGGSEGVLVAFLPALSGTVLAYLAAQDSAGEPLVNVKGSQAIFLKSPIYSDLFSGYTRALTFSSLSLH